MEDLLDELVHLARPVATSAERQQSRLVLGAGYEVIGEAKQWTRMSSIESSLTNVESAVLDLDVDHVEIEGDLAIGIEKILKKQCTTVELLTSVCRLARAFAVIFVVGSLALSSAVEGRRRVSILVHTFRAFAAPLACLMAAYTAVPCG